MQEKMQSIRTGVVEPDLTPGDQQTKRMEQVPKCVLMYERPASDDVRLNKRSISGVKRDVRLSGHVATNSLPVATEKCLDMPSKAVKGAWGK